MFVEASQPTARADAPEDPRHRPISTGGWGRGSIVGPSTSPIVHCSFGADRIVSCYVSESMPVSDLPDPLTPEEWEGRYGPAWTVPDSEFPPDPPSRSECLARYRRVRSIVPLSVLEKFLRTLDEEDLQWSLEAAERV